MTITPSSPVDLGSWGYVASSGRVQTMLVSFVGRQRLGGGLDDSGQAVEVQASTRADAIFQIREQYIVSPDSAINVNVIRGPGED